MLLVDVLRSKKVCEGPQDNDGLQVSMLTSTNLLNSLSFSFLKWIFVDLIEGSVAKRKRAISTIAFAFALDS